MKFLYRQKGMTLPEALIATAILGLMVTALTTAFSTIYRSSSRSQSEVMRDKYLARLIGDIQSNPSAYVPNFSDNSLGGVTNDQILTIATLPIAFGPNYYGATSGCSTCDGRLGFVVRPYYGYSGLYVVTIRVVTSVSVGTYQDISELVAER